MWKRSSAARSSLDALEKRKAEEYLNENLRLVCLSQTLKRDLIESSPSAAGK